MVHLAIVGTIGAAVTGASVAFPPIGLALGALVFGIGLMARGD